MLSKTVYYHLECSVVGSKERAMRDGSMIVPDKYVGIDAISEYIIQQLALIWKHDIRIDITRIDV